MRYKLPLSAAIVLIGLILLWQAGASLRVSAPPSALVATSLYPPSTDEPISPIPQSLPLDARKVALGKLLFNDTRLSRDDTVACASCHVLAKGGADGRKQPVGIGGQLGRINAPTVLNSAFNFRQFWDGRAASLEDQVDGPVQNPAEMGSDWPSVIEKLARDAAYPAAFRAAYADGLNPANVRNAIAEFERSLITPRSRFDRYLQGERDAISHDELKGYQLFKNYGCVACHQGVNVGANLYQRLGVMQPYFVGDADAEPANRGRAAITGSDEDLHVFKVPGLRNVALTAPYFHDGSIASLEEAVAIMARFQLGVNLPSQDVALIVGFLKTLTGEYGAAPQ